MSPKSREQYLGSGDISDCGTCSSCPTSIERCFSNTSDWCELQLYRAIAMKRWCIVARGARYPSDSRVETPPRVMRTKNVFFSTINKYNRYLYTLLHRESMAPFPTPNARRRFVLGGQLCVCSQTISRTALCAIFSTKFLPPGSSETRIKWIARNRHYRSLQLELLQLCII